MKCLRKIQGVGVMQRIGNKDIRLRCVDKASLLERVDQRTLRRFSRMERMDEGRLTKGIYRTVWLGGGGRLRRRWKDGVGKFIERKGFKFEKSDELLRNISDWKGVMDGDRNAENGPKD